MTGTAFNQKLITYSEDLTSEQAVVDFRSYAAVGGGTLNADGLSSDNIMWSDVSQMWRPDVVSASVWVDIAEFADEPGVAYQGDAVIIGWGSVREILATLKRPEQKAKLVKAKAQREALPGTPVGGPGTAGILSAAGLNLNGDGDRRFVIGDDTLQTWVGPYFWDYPRPPWPTTPGTFKITFDRFDGWTVEAPSGTYTGPLGPKGFPLLWPVLGTPLVGLYTANQPNNPNIVATAWGYSFLLESDTAIGVGSGDNGALHRR